MSRKAKPLPEARWWTKSQLAAHFSRPVDWINKNYNRLVKEGMPEQDELFNAFDAKAIEAWENERSRISNDPARKEHVEWESQLANGEI